LPLTLQSSSVFLALEHGPAFTANVTAWSLAITAAKLASALPIAGCSPLVVCKTSNSYK
jgi:hypothetical protein